MYEDDYIIRKIKTTLQAIASILKGKKDIESSLDEKNNNIVITEDEMLHLMIVKYINSGEINKGENAIFQAIESDKSAENLEVALFFYEEINKWDEVKLKNCNFSKKEIADGLEEVKKIYAE